MLYKPIPENANPVVVTVCRFGSRILSVARSSFAFVLVLTCFVFLFWVNRFEIGRTYMNLREIDPKDIPWEATDYVVANASAALLTAIQRQPPEFRVRLTEERNQTEIPIVVYWHAFFVQNFAMFVPQTGELDCPYRCIHTADHALGGRAAVRVFRHRNFDATDLPPDNPNAYNILHSVEPPFFTYSAVERKARAPLDYFNVTSTYRTKSAVWYPYDRFVPQNGRESAGEVWSDEEVKAKVAGKQGAVLVAVSRCVADSMRQDYVSELRKHLKITQVGPCPGSNVVCKKEFGNRALADDTSCMQRLNDEHFFYLTFENSVCPEYQSEKFWRVKQLIVPIVLSRGVIPPHIPGETYIATSDFESPKQLANYLQHLMNNRSEYAKYFDWTKRFRKTVLSESEIRVACQYCKLAYSRVPMRIADYKRYWDLEECSRNYARDLIAHSPAVIEWEERFAQIMNRTYRERNMTAIV